MILILAAVMGIWALGLLSLAFTLPPEFFSLTAPHDAAKSGA